MSKNTSKTKKLLLAGLLSFALLTSCGGGGNNPLFNRDGVGPGNWGGWGDDDDWDDDDDDWEDDDDDDDDEKSSRQGGSSSSSAASSSQPSAQSHDNNTTGVPDYTELPDLDFSWSRKTWEASVCFTSESTSENIVIPSKVVIDGNVYTIVDDDKTPGLSYKMTVVNLTLSEGFRAIENGFAHDMNLVTLSLPSTIEKFVASIFVGCVNLQTVKYNGTKSQWNSINKNSYWNYNAKAFTVECLDGNLSIPEWES